MTKILPILVALFSLSCMGQINSGLVAFYPFCGNANDLSLQDNHAEINGATLTPDRFGNLESAFLFDGINDYIEVKNSNSLNNLNEEISISVWFNTKSYYSTNSNWATLMTKSGNLSSDGSRHFSLYYKDNGDIYFNTHVVGNFNFLLNEWYHLTITYNSGTVLTYVNGSLIKTTTVVNDIPSNQLSITFGYDRPGVVEYYHGTLDDIRIYDRVLTENDVLLLNTEEIECSTLSVNQVESGNNLFYLSTNTSKETLIVSTKTDQNKTLACYNLEGKLLFKKAFNKPVFGVDISHLNTGIYILKLISQDGVYVKKILKK